MPTQDFSSYKVTNLEISSATKFDNLVQAIQDGINALDNANVAAAANIAVSKLAAGTDGQVVTTSGGAVSWQNAASASVPTGVLSAFVGTAAPAGWLLCDGSAVSRTTYSALFAVIGTAYGTGDGSTTFNLPDLRGRAPVGLGTDADVNALGKNDGTAIASRTPNHTHTTGIGGTGSQYNAQAGVQPAATGTYTSSSSGPSFEVVNFVVKT